MNTSEHRHDPLWWCLLLLMCLASSTEAALSTQSFNQILKRGDNLPEGQEQATFAVDRFEASLGNLIGVSLTLDSHFSSGAVFYHPMSSNFSYTPRHYLALEINGLDNPPDLTLDHTLPAQHYTDVTPSYGGAYWKPTAQEYYGLTVSVPTEELAQYVDDTPFDLTITIEDRSLYEASNPLAYINDKYVISDLHLTVEYEYTPAVPLPGAWALLLVGLGMCWITRQI